MTEIISVAFPDEQIQTLKKSAKLLLAEAKRRNCDTLNTRLQYTAQNKSDLEGPTEADVEFGRFAKTFVEVFFVDNVPNDNTIASVWDHGNTKTDFGIAFMGVCSSHTKGYPIYRFVLDIEGSTFFVRITKDEIQISVMI